jgi:diguanylate cyclase (GGDEF)-like protein
LRNAVSRNLVETPAGNLKVTISIGGVATAEWPKNNPSQILQMADLALYRAKGDGRDRSVIAGLAEHEAANRVSRELSSQAPQKE